MNNEMLVECDPYETRIAILEDDRLAEVFIERHESLGTVGNVYLGRVHRILPGMQAAFVDVGLERDAFLYVDEVVGRPEQLEDDDGDLDGGGDHRRERPDQPPISDLLVLGQDVLVQVIKDAMPGKGARVTTQITLPGRSLVLLPEVRHLGVSRRIEDEDERRRLRAVLEALRPDSAGLIVRTAGSGASREALEQELAYLEKVWRELRERAAVAAAPALLHRDLTLALRIIRDYVSEDYRAVWIQNPETHERAVEFLTAVEPRLAERVRRFEPGIGLFEEFEVNQAIDAALRARVWLESGGYIVIHETEALVAIDVNTGKYVGSRDLEDTVLKTNLEAVREVVRQIRLRNLGGIIVVDFIDMTDEENRHAVFAALEREMARDRAKHKLLAISEFGLVEITRKRSRPSLERTLTATCDCCRGAGRVKSAATVALELRRKLLQHTARFRGRTVVCRVNPQVAEALEHEHFDLLEEIEAELDARLVVEGAPDQPHAQFELVV